MHACCAPCSSAIVEWLVAHGVCPTIFYYNPNIFPREEYEIRKNESKRHAESLGLTWIDGDYNHEQWREGVCGLENEPERGRRCERCFTLRLVEAAKKAYADGADYLGVGAIYPTTTKVKTVLTSTDTLDAITKAVPIPVNAIGGLNAGNIDILKGINISGVCAVSAIMKADSPKEAASALKRAFLELRRDT